MRAVLFGLLIAAVAAAPASFGQSVALTPAQREALGVRTGKVEAAAELPLDRLPATVRAPLEGSAVVTTPYAGVVIAVLAREGQFVKRRQPLARIQSREAMTLGADLAAAKAAWRVADAQATRDRQLLEEGIIPAARAQASLAQRDAAAARLRELEAARALAPTAAGGAAGVYELRAPIAGRVLERAVRVGEPAEMLAKAFVIARGDRVMVEMRVPARDAAELRVGLPIRVAGGAAGTVTEIGAMVDPNSQSILVRAEVASDRLRPGQQTFATLMLPAPAGALELASAALVEREGAYVVFMVRGGRFTAVPVQVLAQTADGRSVVSGALAAGTEVVVAGAGSLKSLPEQGR